MNLNDRNPQPSDWPSVRDLFERCIGAPAEQRAEMLARAEPDVRSEVTELLRRHEDCGDRLEPEQLHQQLMDASGLAPAVGSSITGFRIMAPIGRGGMGTVFLAEQDTPRRQVAIKLLAAGLVGEDGARRFRQEAQLLAQLRHPGIAQIFEAGVDTTGAIARPYFVLEYVAGGRPITAWARELDRPLRDLLRMFCRLCDAVQHAHEHGVVHRDLKPQNVLVDNCESVKVIDFGIARSVGKGDHGQATRTGELVGTLRYMSPEQARGEPSAITTRTDVHALGAILLEMLTGTTPFDLEGKSLPEAGRILSDVDARRLRDLRPDLDPDLDVVVATSLSKRTENRYATAGSLAADVRRFLRREPITARSPSFTYQLRMFARRRRGLVAFLLLATGSVSLGATSSLFYAIRAERAEARTRADVGRRIAAVNRVLEMAMRRAVEVPRQLEGLPNSTAARRELIENAMTQLEFVERELEPDAQLHGALATAYVELAELLGYRSAGHLGRPDEARETLRTAERHAHAALHTAPNDERAWRALYRSGLVGGSLSLDHEQEFDEVHRQFDQADRALSQLTRSVPAHEHACMTSDLLAARASLYRRERDFPAALEQLRQAIAVRRAARRGPKDVESAMAVGNMLRHVANIREFTSSLAEAREAWDDMVQTLAIAEQLPGRLPLCRLAAVARVRLGFVLGAEGQADLATHQLRAGHAELARVLAADPANAKTAEDLADASMRLARHLLSEARKRPEGTARPLLEEALRAACRGLETAERLESRDSMLLKMVVGSCRQIRDACEAELR